jgi:hypothetical protein
MIYTILANRSPNGYVLTGEDLQVVTYKGLDIVRGEVTLQLLEVDTNCMARGNFTRQGVNAEGSTQV